MNSSSTAFVGSIPENYDTYLGPLFFDPYAADLIGRIQPNELKTVLEIACGTGRLTQQLQVILPAQSQLVASDLNEDMLTVAKKRLSDKKNIIWLAADAQNLPFEDNSFDLVICQYGVMFFPDKPKAFREAKRVLKPGGKYLFNSWDSISNNKLIQSAKETVNLFFENDPPTFYEVPFSFYHIEEIRSLLEEAGFSEVTMSKVRKDTSSPTAEDAAKGIVLGNPIYGHILDRDPALVPTICTAVRDAFAEQFGDRPLRVTMNAIVSEATKR